MSQRPLTIVAGLALGLLVLFGLMQLIPTGVSHTNPPVVSEPKWDSPPTRALAQRACFDCHSNETAWPAYTNVAPVSWLIAHDVADGRARLNFSTWGQPNPNSDRSVSTDQMVSVIQNGSMPPAIYLPLHPTAALTPAEQQQLMTGFLNTFK